MEVMREQSGGNIKEKDEKTTETKREKKQYKLKREMEQVIK